MDFKDVEKLRQKKRKFNYVFFFILFMMIIYLPCLIFINVGTVDGISMLPTLQDGDIEVSIKAQFTEIHRGDIVNIDSVVLGKPIVKRVIGISGDHIVISNGFVYRNGELLHEPYIYEQPEENEYVTGGTVEEYDVMVPNGYVFVMGDNRLVSSDSRVFGCVSIAEIKSKLLFTVR